jgi:hypothetical protein
MSGRILFHPEMPGLRAMLRFVASLNPGGYERFDRTRILTIASEYFILFNNLFSISYKRFYYVLKILAARSISSGQNTKRHVSSGDETVP